MENIHYRMEDMLHQIRKIKSYNYQSSNFMELFKLHDDKPYVIRGIISTREYNNDNYDKSIYDIIDYYNDRSAINELKRILKSIIPTLEIPKQEKYAYYQTKNKPQKILVIGGYNNLMRNRITNIMSNLIV